MPPLGGGYKENDGGWGEGVIIRNKDIVQKTERGTV